MQIVFRFSPRRFVGTDGASVRAAKRFTTNSRHSRRDRCPDLIERRGERGWRGARGFGTCVTSGELLYIGGFNQLLVRVKGGCGDGGGGGNLLNFNLDI